MNTGQVYDEITFIKKIMVDSQKVIRDNGKVYITWSSLAILCIVLKYVKTALGFQFNYIWIGIAVMIIGSILTYRLKRQSATEMHIKTFSQKILSGIWMAWGISILILVIVGYLSGAIADQAIPAIIAAIMGGGQYVSGIASNNSLLRNAAYGWWVGAILMFVLPGEYTIALLGAMLIAFQLVPGVVIYRKWKQEMVLE
jgi:hypothetical protein